MSLTLKDRKFNNKPNFDILMEKPDSSNSSRKPVHEAIKDYICNLIQNTKNKMGYKIAKLAKPNIVQQ